MNLNQIATPWGPSQYVHFHGDDRKVVRVGTAEHGGIGVLAGLELPAPFAGLGLTDSEGAAWYEEDQAYAIPVCAFPDRFPANWVDAARATLRDEFPEAYMAHFGVVLTSATSRALARREFEDATRDKFTVSTAFGSSHWNVPSGFVMACGWRRRDEAVASFLVPVERYEVNPGRLVLDEFPRWEPDRSLPYLKPAENRAASHAAG